MSRMRNVQPNVIEILKSHPETRDNDTLLILAYMCFHHGLLDELGAPAYQRMKQVLMAQQTPSLESVTRARRKAQELYEDLRGERYERRHKTDEPEMREWSNNYSATPHHR